MDTQAAIAIAEQSPEVVAARAAVHLLMQQETIISREVDRLRSERQALQTDLASMMITKQDAQEALTTAQRQHKDLTSQVATIYQQVVAVRNSAAVLISKRDQLKNHVETLHSEIALLERARIGASRAVAAAAASESTVPKRRPPTPPTIRPNGVVLSGREAKMAAHPEVEAAEVAAFDDFFNAEVEHDKAREWIMSDIS